MNAAFAVHRSAPVLGGAAPAVWLLHGVFADHHLWDDVVARTRDRTVVALDAFGHGAAPAVDRLPALDGQAELLAGLLRSQADGPVVMAGHSWGGMLALRLAVKHPDLLAALLLTNTPLLRTRGSTRLGFLAQRSLLAGGFPPAAYGRRAAAALYGPAYRREHRHVQQETADVVRGLGRRGAMQVLNRVILEPDDAVALLGDVTVPTVVLAGTRDYVGSPSVRARVQDTGHELRLHPGGHMGPREAPAHVADALREVLLSGSIR